MGILKKFMAQKSKIAIAQEEVAGMQESLRICRNVQLLLRQGLFQGLNAEALQEGHVWLAGLGGQMSERLKPYNKKENADAPKETKNSENSESSRPSESKQPESQPPASECPPKVE